MIRVSDRISPAEQDYVNQRRVSAQAAFSSWLTKTSSEFDQCYEPPVLAFSASGGGERAQLMTTAAHMAFDNRSGNGSVAGLWQALTYESALSGGGLFLIGWAMNDYAPIPRLVASLWQPALHNGLLYPLSNGTMQDNSTKAIIYGEIYQKALAGYPVSYLDILGRYLAYSVLSPNGNVSSHFRDITSQSMFQNYDVPFPMIVSTGVNQFGDSCPSETLTAPQYEFNPFEFGSWDEGVSAFINMTYLGSQPMSSDNTTACVTDYDSTGFIIGTSGDAFGLDCFEINSEVSHFLNDYSIPSALVSLSPSSLNQSLAARYPNPFYNSPSSPAVNTYETLAMVDGGLLKTGVAIWPLLFRDVDVIFVSDNGADSNNMYTNGTDMYRTYLRAQQYGLTQMPAIPDPETVLDKGFDRRNVFYGCGDEDVLTIVYMPNRDVVYPSNYTGTPAPMSAGLVEGLLADGVAIATEGGAEDWGQCVGCAILMKADTELPGFCGACFEKYCAVWDE